MNDRSKLIDLTLAFAATFVITLSIWPQTQPHQLVRCKVAESGWQIYGVPVNDPQLEELRQTVVRLTQPEYDPTYVTAKWQKEVAEFYEQNQPRETAATEGDDEQESGATTMTLSDDVSTASYQTAEDQADRGVQTVSYVDNGRVRSAELSMSQRHDSTVVGSDQNQPVSGEGVSEHGDEPAAVAPTAESGIPSVSPSDVNYWTNVKATAVESMREVEDRVSNSPIVMDSVVEYGWPQLAFHFAFLFGLLAACGYMHWTKHTPLVEQMAISDQPKSVIARIATLGTLTAVAMCSALTVWL